MNHGHGIKKQKEQQLFLSDFIDNVLFWVIQL